MNIGLLAVIAIFIYGCILSCAFGYHFGLIRGYKEAEKTYNDNFLKEDK